MRLSYHLVLRYSYRFAVTFITVCLKPYFSPFYPVMPSTTGIFHERDTALADALPMATRPTHWRCLPSNQRPLPAPSLNLVFALGRAENIARRSILPALFLRRRRILPSRICGLSKLFFLPLWFYHLHLHTRACGPGTRLPLTTGHGHR